MNRILLCLVLTTAATAALNAPARDMLCDHVVRLDNDGRLLPWTSYDHVLTWSMNFIKGCPTTRTKFGDDPWYLVTSKLTKQAGFMRNQNCQASHAFWGVETLIRYYAFSGDAEAIRPIRLILDRILLYHTPADWAWANVPRTQDNSPDGEYTDLTSEPDKMAAVGIAYLKFYKLTGEEKYLVGAMGIAASLARHVGMGSATNSPLPFRVNLKSGVVLDGYTAHMVSAVLLFDEMLRLGENGSGDYAAKRDLLWKWVLDYPVKNNRWIGYYEDVGSNPTNRNQQSPMESARFMLQRPELDPDYRAHVSALLSWVANRFGETKRYGATSIREQDGCFFEMSSHTTRYASVLAKWSSIAHDARDRQDALASFALSTYSAYSKLSHDDVSVNYVGIGYVNPWFIDSYFDYLAHFLEGMAELPEMAPADSNHIIGSDSVIQNVSYSPTRIDYRTFEPSGHEILRLSSRPEAIFVEGKALAPDQWHCGEERGVSGVLRVHRRSGRNILIRLQAKPASPG